MLGMVQPLEPPDAKLPARRLHARGQTGDLGRSAGSEARVPARLAEASDYHCDAIPSPKNVRIR
jgi:hypothetical protein